jgi:hypothetical protein
MKTSALIMTADPESPRQMMQVGQIRALDRINAVLAWCCLGLAAGLAVYHYWAPSMPPAPVLTAHQAPVAVREFVHPSPATDGRTAEIKNLFEPAIALNGTSADLSSQYKVVGIILDRHSQAVLKDRQSGKSFFVHKGDRLGDAVIGDIQDGKVVLSMGDRNWELRP